MFDGNPFIYYLKASEFFRAACRLEEVANFGDLVWSEEFAKDPCSQNFQNACQDRKCRHVSAYLFTHGLELTLKSICLQKGATKTIIHDTHKITKLLAIAEEHVEIPDNFKSSSKFAKRLDEVLIWAGRYPEPKETQRTYAVPTMSNAPLGKTDDLVTALSDDLKRPLKPLKDLCEHIFQQATNLFSPKSHNSAAKSEETISS